jgi:methyl-accepting chemotaxis protein
METDTAALAASLDRSRTLLLIVAVTSLLAAGGIGVFYVRRRLVRRLSAIGDAMRRLSSGDVDLKVPATGDSDEIGEMARSLEVFRDGEIERRSYADRQHAAQLAEHKHAVAINQRHDHWRRPHRLRQRIANGGNRAHTVGGRP